MPTPQDDLPDTFIHGTPWTDGERKFFATVALGLGWGVFLGIALIAFGVI